MDYSLKRFVSRIRFSYDKRIIDLFLKYGIEHTLSDDIYCPTKEFVVNVFISGNIEVFSELGNIIIDNRDYCFGQGYYYFFSSVVFCYGNLEMIDFFKHKINLSNVLSDHFRYLAYRIDDNVEAVDAVLNGLIIGEKSIPYFDMALITMDTNNINIFKYLYQNVLIHKDPELRYFDVTKKTFLWSTYDVNFLDFFISKSLLSEDDIVDGISIVNTKNKLDVVLSYVESGRLKLSDKTVELLNESINKN
jgi:hypothetical protein